MSSVLISKEMERDAKLWGNLYNSVAESAAQSRRIMRKQLAPWEFPDDSWANGIDWDMLVCPEVTTLERELEAEREEHRALRDRLEWVGRIIGERQNEDDYDRY